MAQCDRKVNRFQQTSKHLNRQPIRFEANQTIVTKSISICQLAFSKNRTNLSILIQFRNTIGEKFPKSKL
jgi:hypothetical protein